MLREGGKGEKKNKRPKDGRGIGEGVRKSKNKMNNGEKVKDEVTDD